MPAFPKSIASHLAKAKLKHQPVEHRKVFTAYDTAMTTRTPLEQVAKNVVVRAGSALHLLVVPAHHLVDLKAVAKQLGVAAGKVKIVTEQAIAKGADLAKNHGLTSFGSLYELPVLVEKDLLKAKRALFPAGSFQHSVLLSVKDFVAAEGAAVAKFGKVNRPLLAYARKSLAQAARRAKRVIRKRPSRGKASRKARR